MATIKDAAQIISTIVIDFETRALAILPLATIFRMLQIGVRYATVEKQLHTQRVNFKLG